MGYRQMQRALPFRWIYISATLLALSLGVQPPAKAQGTTGARPDTVLQNARDLKIDLSDVREVILTHNHSVVSVG